MIDVILRMLRLRPVYPPVVGEHDDQLGPEDDPVQGECSTGHFWFKVYPHRFDAHDPLLARLLRGALRCIQSHDPTLKTVALGPTLLGWYQIRSQLPWKKEIHVGIRTDSVAKISFLDLVPSKDASCIKPVPITASDSYQHIGIHAGTREIDLFIFRLPSTCKVRQSMIDAGTPIFIPTSVKSILRDRYNKSLDIHPPPGWRWNTKSHQFVRLSSMHYALSWPPTESTLVLAAKALILIVMLLLCWIILSFVLSKQTRK